MKYTLFILTTVLGSCATLTNTPLQEVPFIISSNTIIKDTVGKTYIPKKISDSVYTLELQRRNDYTFDFHNNGMVYRAALQKKLNTNFIFGDILLYFSPLIIDGITQAWYEFDGLRVTFPDSTNDLKEPMAVNVIIDEIPLNYTWGKDTRFGLAIVLGFGGGVNSWFSANPAPLITSLGAGYRFTNDVSVYGMYYRGMYSSLGQLKDNVEGSAVYNEGSLEFRYFPDSDKGWFILAGGGYRTITTSSLYKYDTDHQKINFFEAQNNGVFTVHSGFGYAGTGGFIELRTNADVTPTLLANRQMIRHFEVLLHGGFHIVF
jgi:hypothetical protein